MLKYTVKKYCAQGSKMNQVLVSVLMVMPVFSYGSAIGWMSPMGPLLMSPDGPTPEPVHPDVISWMASVVYLVGIPTVFVYGYIVDNFGRKKALILTSISMALCWSLKLFSTSTWALITARGILGFGAMGTYVVTPLYIKEISEDTIRGTLGSLVVLSQNLGNLVVYMLGEYLSYRGTLWICLAVPVLHVVLFLTMPETPSYLLKCGKVEAGKTSTAPLVLLVSIGSGYRLPLEFASIACLFASFSTDFQKGGGFQFEARDTLAWLRCRDPSEAAVDSELQILLLELEKSSQGEVRSTLKTLVTDRSTFRAFRITLIITLARELCGCLAVLHFASLIFSKATGGNEGWVLTANQQAVVLGVVQFVGSCTASFLVERTGRKFLLGSTCFVSGIAMVALGAWFFAAAQTGSVSWLPIAALCLCIYCDAAGLQPVPFVIMTEMFSFQLRGTVTSIVIAMACALVSVELRVFHPLATAAGLHTIFWIFSSVCLVSTVYIALVVPETRMKTLDEIYAAIGGKKEKEQKDDCERAVTKL